MNKNLRRVLFFLCVFNFSLTLLFLNFAFAQDNLPQEGSDITDTTLDISDETEPEEEEVEDEAKDKSDEEKASEEKNDDEEEEELEEEVEVESDEDEENTSEAEIEEDDEIVTYESEDQIDVEYDYRIYLDEDLKHKYFPYKRRKENWGVNFSYSQNQYQPSNYQSVVTSQFFEDDFPIGVGTMTELGIEFKFNTSFGSLGIELSTGELSIVHDTKSFSIRPQKASLNVILDSFFDEPYVAPFFKVGFYSFDFKDLQPGVNASLDGNQGTTAFSPFYSFGFLFQLDWMVPESAIQAFQAWNMENTYLALQATSYLASSDIIDGDLQNSDPNFESQLNFGAGIIVEF